MRAVRPSHLRGGNQYSSVVVHPALTPQAQTGLRESPVTIRSRRSRCHISQDTYA